MLLRLSAAFLSTALSAWGAQVGADDLALRDAWVRRHLPPGVSGLSAGSRSPVEPIAELVVLESYGEIFRNTVPGKGLAVAGRNFGHGLYCHAPSRVRVCLPGPGRSFAAVVGILDNPDSVGGSVVFSVEHHGAMAFASPILRRGELGLATTVALDGAEEFLLNVGNAGDGISSDQAVWGDAVVTLQDGSSIRLGDFPVRDGRVSERSDPAPPFSFLVDGRPSDEVLRGWKFEERVEALDASRRRRVRTHTDPATGLALRITLVEYADFPTVEWTLSFANTGPEDSPLLSGIQALDIAIPAPESGPFSLHSIAGDSCTAESYRPWQVDLPPGFSQSLAAEGGRPTNGGFPFWNISGEEGGVIAVLGWPGQWAARFERDAGRSLRIVAGQEQTRFRLRPGEELRAPLAVLQFYQGDWIRGQNLWRRWMVAHNLPRPGGSLVPTHYAGCWSADLQPRADTELTILDGFLRNGVKLDYWIIDAGWYPDGGSWPYTGTWEVDREQFPRGIREVSDHARANGLDFVLWFEPERAAGGSWLTENHPEWVIGGKGGGLVNLGDPAAWSWVTETIDGLITSQGVDAYRQDFNIDPLAYWRSLDTADRQGIAEIKHVTGYLAFWDELLRRHPNLWIDSCASGGRRNDLETLRRSVPLLRSDYFSEPESQQCHTYGLSLWLPYHGSGLGASDSYWFRSCIFPASRVGWDTRLDGLDYPLLKRMIAEFRAVQPYLLGDYYPLTPYSLERVDWIAWQFDAPEQGGGMVQAFRRADCAEETLPLRLRGLEPAAAYQLEDLETGARSRHLGAELMGQGIRIALQEKPAAALLVYRKAP